LPKTKITKKSETDKFYTKKEIAIQCIELVGEFIKISGIEIDEFIEPSAGNGSFYDNLPYPKTGYDIIPENKNIIQKNFFEVNLPPKKICIIGNPPFGERGNLARRFIEHSLGASIIALILPKTYNKHTNQRVFPEDYSLVKSIEIPRNSFILNGEEYDVPTIFQIWAKGYDGPNIRKRVKWNKECQDFRIHKEGELFVFGASPNKVINASNVKPNNRGYFLQCKADIDFIRKIFLKGNWKKYGNSSVNGGAFWLSSEELIEAYMSERNEHE